jgi:predicted DNA-binding protein
MGRKVSRTVFLDPEDLEFLEMKSAETGRSISTLIREAVKSYIRVERGRRRASRISE